MIAVCAAPKNKGYCGKVGKPHMWHKTLHSDHTSGLLPPVPADDLLPVALAPLEESSFLVCGLPIFVCIF